MKLCRKEKSCGIFCAEQKHRTATCNDKGGKVQMHEMRETWQDFKNKKKLEIAGASNRLAKNVTTYR